ncbi:MAG: DNA repair protein RadC [Alphaproteobacteria bacterium]|nr:DNA repair protein RadC [Alphaproteobacteria bacterium]
MPEPKHHDGHRERLRQRFLDKPDSLADYELLEMLLFVIPRKDVKPLAKDLLKKFGSLHAVFSASPKELTDCGLSDNAVATLKATQQAALRFLKQDVMQKPVLNNWTRLVGYLQAAMAQEKREMFRLLFLNKKNELIADEVQQTGTVDHTPAYPREVLKRALEIGATALILVHNHPSGDPNPSQADIDLTKAIISAGKTLNITVHDHIIVSRNGFQSLRTLGLI